MSKLGFQNQYENFCFCVRFYLFHLAEFTFEVLVKKESSDGKKLNLTKIIGGIITALAISSILAVASTVKKVAVLEERTDGFKRSFEIVFKKLDSIEGKVDAIK